MRTVYVSDLIPNQPKSLSDTDRILYRIVHSFVLQEQNSDEFEKEIPSKEITMLITRCMRGTLYDWLIVGGEFELIEETQNFVRTILVKNTSTRK